MRMRPSDFLSMRALSLWLILILTFAAVSLAQGKASYLPNAKLTPGATLDVTKDDLCGPERADLSHSVPVALKRQVFDLYGVRGDSPGSYDVDHLIPVSLGGSSAIKNLWPQPMSGEWNHDMKNKLEQRLHKMVCKGELDLKTAQQEIASDWVRAYKKYVGEPTQNRPKRNSL